MRGSGRWGRADDAGSPSIYILPRRQGGVILEKWPNTHRTDEMADDATSPDQEQGRPKFPEPQNGAVTQKRQNSSCGSDSEEGLSTTYRIIKNFSTVWLIISPTCTVRGMAKPDLADS